MLSSLPMLPPFSDIPVLPTPTSRPSESRPTPRLAAPKADPVPRLTRAVQKDARHPGRDDIGFGQLQQTRTHQLVASFHCPGAALGPRQRHGSWGKEEEGGSTTCPWEGKSHREESESLVSPAKAGTSTDCP